MKILILSLTFGGGHNSAANAMKEYFTAADAACETLDTFGYVSPTIADSINKGHLFVSGHMGRAFGIGYHSAEKRRPIQIAQMTPAQIMSMPLARDILTYISQSKPDAILFTHCFAGIVLHLLKKEGKITVPTVGIVTDFAFHPYWEDCTANDYVVIPSPDLRFQGRRKGFSDGQMLPLGIPISPRFGESMAKAAARERLGLAPNGPTVLLMGGSMGHGKMADSVAALDALPLGEDFQIIVVCGANKKMLSDMEKLETKHRVLKLGFANNVDVLMDASDVIVTKPGGLTTSEALAKRLPMIIVNPIPGQESRNAEFLLNSGTALATNDLCGADELVYRLLTNPTRREAMQKCIDALRCPQSTRNICEFVLRLGQDPDTPEKS